MEKTLFDSRQEQEVFFSQSVQTGCEGSTKPLIEQVMGLFL